MVNQILVRIGYSPNEGDVQGVQNNVDECSSVGFQATLSIVGDALQLRDLVNALLMEHTNKSTNEPYLWCEVFKRKRGVGDQAFYMIYNKRNEIITKREMFLKHIQELIEEVETLRQHVTARVPPILRF